MKVLITGASGQLGTELQRTTPAGIDVHATDVAEIDVTDAGSIEGVVCGFAPQWVINCAAYTAVDRAEDDSDRAMAINATGPKLLAEAAMEHGARLIQLSTDFVFDGNSSKPYQPGDVARPLSVYGATKLAGEQHVVRESAERSIIVRTAWVYSAHGSNFVKTMLRLMNERKELGIVADQIGTPSWARNLAQILWTAVESNLSSGLYHWTDAGCCSWYDFAVAIQEEALALGLLDREIPVKPLRTDQYPTLARRPYYSVLDRSALMDALQTSGQHWRKALRQMLEEVRDNPDA